MDKQRLAYIDLLANSYYCTPSKDTLSRLVTEIEPIVCKIAFKYIGNDKNTQDHEDLCQILRMDICDLVSRRWTMSKTLPFHYLMLRQLRNKSLNWVAKPDKKEIEILEEILPFKENDLPEQLFYKELVDQMFDQCNDTKHPNDKVILDMLMLGHTPGKIRRILNMGWNSYKSSMDRLRSYASEYRDTS